MPVACESDLVFLFAKNKLNFQKMTKQTYIVRSTRFGKQVNQFVIVQLQHVGLYRDLELVSEKKK